MLFSLYVAGIEKIIPGESDIGMFADDITLWCSSPGREWGADAQTLRTTDIALIRPILEYGFPVYFCASPSNLLQLERVQLSAARIITGLRNSCPNDVVLYDANLAPLSLWLEHRNLDEKAWFRCPMSPNTIQVHTEYVLVKSVGPKVFWAECTSSGGLENISLLFSSMPKLWRWRSVVSPSIVPELIRTVTCMVLKAKSNDMRTSSPLPR
ncbi:putative RNA-directed DNA polymerase from transposon BS [Trichonephila clavipes]|nr:putative RNA-directed DNA polymerase from transposon BS [Trichonephila clavipes]